MICLMYMFSAVAIIWMASLQGGFMSNPPFAISPQAPQDGVEYIYYDDDKISRL